MTIKNHPIILDAENYNYDERFTKLIEKIDIYLLENPNIIIISISHSLARNRFASAIITYRAPKKAEKDDIDVF